MAETKIDVDDEATYLSAMEGKLNKWGQMNDPSNFTIFRAPLGIQESKKNLLEPSVISIGPFHHGEKRFQAMEEKKWRFLQDFLSRADHLSLDLCISEMKLLEERARRCYSETVDLGSHAFAEMLLLDGCFVLEYILKENQQRWSNSLFEFGWNCASIYTDLLVLENQIPFFVVEKLCEIGLNEDRNYLVKALIPLLALGPTDYINHGLIENPPTQIHHLVHLYHCCSVPNYPIIPFVSRSKSFHLTRILSPCRIKDLLLETLWVLAKRFSSSTSQSSSLASQNTYIIAGNKSQNTSQNTSINASNTSQNTSINASNTSQNTSINASNTSQNTSLASQNTSQITTRNTSMFVIPCASELQDAGIKFRVKDKPQHMLDISFVNGVLKIPEQFISCTTKPLLTNLVAFEQNRIGQMEIHLTSFLLFLNYLVNMQKDVMILQQCDIIHNILSCEKELTNFFNQVGDGLVYGPNHFLAKLYVEVNTYRESSWNKHREKLVRDYFSSPWAVISLIAALVLLVFTFLQSFFAVYAYFVPPSS